MQCTLYNLKTVALGMLGSSESAHHENMEFSPPPSKHHDALARTIIPDDSDSELNARGPGPGCLPARTRACQWIVSEAKVHLGVDAAS
jgi:hypothetical protein